MSDLSDNKSRGRNTAPGVQNGVAFGGQARHEYRNSHMRKQRPRELDARSSTLRIDGRRSDIHCKRWIVEAQPQNSSYIRSCPVRLPPYPHNKSLLIKSSHKTRRKNHDGETNGGVTTHRTRNKKSDDAFKKLRFGPPRSLPLPSSKRKRSPSKNRRPPTHQAHLNAKTLCINMTTFGCVGARVRALPCVFAPPRRGPCGRRCSLCDCDGGLVSCDVCALNRDSAPDFRC